MLFGKIRKRRWQVKLRENCAVAEVLEKAMDNAVLESDKRIYMNQLIQIKCNIAKYTSLLKLDDLEYLVEQLLKNKA